ncbi:Flp family type IVb pilin [Collinsella aerofaciens]|uniref:Flp family type IVb pilin n=1 Tax=Collinsella aerofaciens TaxID=74426 RepID=UPI003D7B6F81
MHAAEIPFGGGVSPRNTRRLRGQSTIEYVLIVAIIGLVVIFAGPQVAGAIRNQFNTVTETLDEGASGIAFKDPVDIPDAKHGTAFAVYSADDNSLMFYKRRGVPQVGDMFNSRRVTEVYTGLKANSTPIPLHQTQATPLGPIIFSM